MKLELRKIVHFHKSYLGVIRVRYDVDDANDDDDADDDDAYKTALQK